MHTFAQKQKPTQQIKLASSKTQGRAFSAQNHAVRSILHLQRTIGNYAVQRLLQSNTEDFEAGSASKGRTGFAHNFSGIPVYQQALSASGQASRSGKSPVDVLSKDGEVPDGPYLDQAVPAPAGPVPAPAVPVALARPTNLLQLLTGWAPGPNRYGFQLNFRCRSTSGDARDLQNQAPNLIWRERVTYTRNDFAHSINPPNPTILPPGGVSFAPANTRRVGANLLEFNNVTDTHWMPTAAVRAHDFRPAGPPPPPGFVGPVRPPLPAIMESRQVYQYSQNGGGTWRYLAGAFIIRRKLFRVAGGLRFQVQKTGVHTTTEPYKP